MQSSLVSFEFLVSVSPCIQSFFIHIKHKIKQDMTQIHFSSPPHFHQAVLLRAPPPQHCRTALQLLVAEGEEPDRPPALPLLHTTPDLYCSRQRTHPIVLFETFLSDEDCCFFGGGTI